MFRSSPVIVRIKDKVDSLSLIVPVALSRKLHLKDREEIIGILFKFNGNLGQSLKLSW